MKTRILQRESQFKIQIKRMWWPFWYDATWRDLGGSNLFADNDITAIFGTLVRAREVEMFFLEKHAQNQATNYGWTVIGPKD